MITIVYDPVNGLAVADGKAEDFVRNLNDGYSVSISTENVIHVARVLVVEEKLKVKFILLSEKTPTLVVGMNQTRLNVVKTLSNSPKVIKGF